MKKSVRGNTKPDGSCEPPLVIHEMALPPGGEWTPQLPGWLVIHVSSGVGYLLYPRMTCELQEGTVVLCSDQIQGSIRASQVGELRLHFFRTEPGKLTELTTIEDQKLLQDAAKDEKLSLRVLPPNAQLSERFKKLSLEGAGNTFPARAQMLQLFIEVFGGNFRQPPAHVAGGLDAKGRLRQMLAQLPVSELLEISFSDLVSKTGCCPRHLSRLFTELVGVSFREKQGELRLARARELLATTDSKVVDVALESGYQSTSLFNLMFKERFGVSPARWREQARGRKPVKQVIKRLRAVGCSRDSDMVSEAGRA